MKNFKRIFTVFCVVLFALALTLLVGCANGFTQKTYKAKSTITRLELEVDVADLVIKSTTAEAKIEYQQNDAFSFYVWEGTDTLLMESQDGVILGTSAPKITVYLPEGCSISVEVENGNITIQDNLTVKNAEISLENGNVVVKNMTATQSAIDVDVENGNIEAQNLSAVDYIDLSVDNGQIVGDRLTSYTVSAESGLGKVDLADVECELLEVEASAGDVSLNRITAKTSVDANLKLGDLKLTLTSAQSKYLITTQIGVGSSNCGDTTVGEITINIKIDIGNATLNFAKA